MAVTWQIIVISTTSVDACKANLKITFSICYSKLRHQNPRINNYYYVLTNQSDEVHSKNYLYWKSWRFYYHVRLFFVKTLETCQPNFVFLWGLCNSVLTGFLPVRKLLKVFFLTQTGTFTDQRLTRDVALLIVCSYLNIEQT